MSRTASAIIAQKAYAAVRAAKAYQSPNPLPEGLRHLFQPYVPSKGMPQAKRKVHSQPAPALPLGTKLIKALVDLQLGICPYCDDWLEFDPDFGIVHPLRPSIDHVMPRSRGGRSLGNKLAMHRECNTQKGDRLPNGCELVWLSAVNARLGL